METGEETIKSTVERMSLAGNQAFKDSVEKTLSALSEVNTLSKGNVEAVVESLTAATKGAETVGAQALAYSKKNWTKLSRPPRPCRAPRASRKSSSFSRSTPSRAWKPMSRK